MTTGKEANMHNRYKNGPCAGWNGYITLPSGILFYSDDGVSLYQSEVTS